MDMLRVSPGLSTHTNITAATDTNIVDGTTVDGVGVDTDTNHATGAGTPSIGAGLAEEMSTPASWSTLLRWKIAERQNRVIKTNYLFPV
ncbi:MAG: hypothetical protein DRO11_06665 [Methanobacteriota archaeon]|nr:MAG: hypothetical protein DRO11_06665 [Euryarchaeota archaeon]